MKQDVVSCMVEILKEEFDTSQLSQFEKERAETAVKRLSNLSLELINSKGVQKEQIESDMKIYISTLASSAGIQAFRIKKALINAIEKALVVALRLGIAAL